MCVGYNGQISRGYSGHKTKGLLKSAVQLGPLDM